MVRLCVRYEILVILWFQSILNTSAGRLEKLQGNISFDNLCGKKGVERESRASDYIAGWENDKLLCDMPWVPKQWGADLIKIVKGMSAPELEHFKGKYDIRMSTLLARNGIYNSSLEIKHVFVVVVVLEEVKPLLAEMKAADPNFKQNDADLSKQLGSLGSVSTGMYKGLRVTVVQVATSQWIPGRHYSGYSQVSAICGSLGNLKRTGANFFADVDLVISFGTAGGYVEHMSIGDSVVASSAIFTHRIRTRDQQSFNWGVYAGPLLQAKKMVDRVNAEAAQSTNPEIADSGKLAYGVIGSQSSYGITPIQDLMHEELNVTALDMETASETQILSQLKIHFISIKVISNGVWVMDSDRMVKEYEQNKEEVSKKGTKALRKVIAFLAPEDDRLGGSGAFKKVSDLSHSTSDEDKHKPALWVDEDEHQGSQPQHRGSQPTVAHTEYKFKSVWKSGAAGHQSESLKVSLDWQGS